MGACTRESESRNQQKLEKKMSMFRSQVPPSCCKSPSQECGVSNCCFEEYVFFQTIRFHGEQKDNLWNCVAQVRLHPSNIHYSGCAHSLAETLSSNLKLVSWWLTDFTIQPPVQPLTNHIQIKTFYFADLRCSGAFGGHTSFWIISLNQTQTNSSDAVKSQ